MMGIGIETGAKSDSTNKYKTDKSLTIAYGFEAWCI